MANIEQYCFICDQVCHEAPTDPKLSSCGPRRRAKNLFILLQRALDLPDLVADQSELVHQISFCKSCLDELEATKGVLDAFDKLKKMAERHKKEIQTKFLESKGPEGYGKSNRVPLEVEGVAQLRNQFVAGLMSRARPVTDSSKTSGVFKRVTRTRTKPGQFPGQATRPPTTSDTITHLPDLPISSIPLVSSEILSADKFEMNGEDGLLNILSENGHEALGSDDLHTGQGSPGPNKIDRSGEGKKMKVSNEPGSSTQQLSPVRKKPKKSRSTPRNKLQTDSKTIFVNKKANKYKCQLCPTKLKYKRDMKRHLQTHSGERPFSCNICQKTFPRMVELKRHELVHSGDKPFFCKFCPKAFARFAHLMLHERVHTGEKPYLCRMCSKAFSRSGHLVTHMRTHTGEKPYKCNFCSKTFSASGDLVCHTRTHTGEKPFKCTICSRQFGDHSNLRRHTETHKPTE